MGEIVKLIQITELQISRLEIESFTRFEWSFGR